MKAFPLNVGRQRAPHAVVLAVALSLGCLVRAQRSWAYDGTPISLNAHLCYDLARDELIALGEFNGAPSAWRWDPRQPEGRQWSSVGAVGPLTIGEPDRMAYSIARQRVVCDSLWGPATWEWDGATWRRVARPNYVFEHIVGHTGRGTVIGFGGMPNYATDLYEWDGSQWSQIPVALPPPRPHDGQTIVKYPAIAYDARHDKIVLYGSGVFDRNGLFFRSYTPVLWEWDAQHGWSSMLLPLPGNVIAWQNLVYGRFYFDEAHGSLVFITSDDAGMRTFELEDRVAWHEVLPKHRFGRLNGIAASTQAYDTRRGVLRTMTYDQVNPYNLGAQFYYTNPALLDSVGAGCPGSLGQPVLDLLHPWTRAWIGRDLQLEMTNLPSSTGVFVAGWSDRHAGARVLPIFLDPEGLSNCAARVSPDSVYVVPGSNHRATVTVPLPNSPMLVGMHVFFQGWSVDPAANPLGMALSNSVRATIGHL